MAKQLQLRKGTTTEHNTFTGAVGEVTVDTTKKTLVVHDGLTVGGTPLATSADLSTNIIHYLPLAYPKSTPPSGYLVMMGQSISQTSYPILFALYGSTLPDMRAYSIRGLDYSRGIDVGRIVLSQQEDTIQNIKGSLKAGSQFDRNTQFIDSLVADGAFSVLAGDKGYTDEASGWGQAWGTEFDASRVVRTSTETRMKNIAFLYIVKAG